MKSLVIVILLAFSTHFGFLGAEAKQRHCTKSKSTDMSNSKKLTKYNWSKIISKKQFSDVVLNKIKELKEPADLCNWLRYNEFNASISKSFYVARAGSPSIKLNTIKAAVPLASKEDNAPKFGFLFKLATGFAYSISIIVFYSNTDDVLDIDIDYIRK